MRKIVALTFISLDGVMQAPGGKGEDPSGGFDLEGWVAPFFESDQALGEEMAQRMSMPFDLLLGRKTYDMFASYWPHHQEEGPGINKATKYVVSDEPVVSDWKETVQVKGDIVEEVKKLKQQDGPMLQVHGSSMLLQTLFANDLVDELWLKTFPLTLGKGKRLFGEGTIPAAFKLFESKTTPGGVVIAYYKRDGQLKLGDIS